MSRKHGSAAPQKSLQLVWLLIGSFALTVASFVTATLLSERRAQGIQVAAQSITTNALPSVSCYSRARTDLRQIEMLLERLTGDETPGRSASADASMLRRSRDALAQEWSECLNLPNYPKEHAVQQRITAHGMALNASIDSVLRKLDAGDGAAASQELYQETEPRIDELDREILETIEINLRESSLLGTEIARLRASAEKTMVVLMALSTALTATAAVIMVRVLRRFTTLMEARVTEMEHFAGRVAHDIRSPLSAVGIALELLRRSPEAGLRGGIIDRATRTVERIGQLVDGLLVFARAGASPAEGAEAQVLAVIEGVVEEMRPLAETSGIELCIDHPVTEARAACTTGVLISLLSNLVGNAIKHMGGSPVRRVRIRTCDLEDAVRFEVHDTGPGIPSELRARIFDPFVRATETTTPGLGLGLATVRRLAEAHGGAVGVAPGADLGSVFWFEVPKPEAGVHGRSKRRPWLHLPSPARAR